MSFDYEEARRVVEAAKRKPGLPLQAFVPLNGPKLSDEECQALQDATGIPVAELKTVFQKGEHA